MNIKNKWWGLLTGLIISIIVGFFLKGGYDTKGDNAIVNNLIGLFIIIAGFLIGWWLEKE
ncbi:hypothetical protein [endosymbiont GvMRE of Glomus versiforme]|uniref:hypothetical protein n=1 Tax=endosymbiont GvMRE of Glomus versiforme TaxID=2039283 RepID=UPI000EC6294C|nr:hypothetical protein [endosymbiont GvMRE of Glomus versiforme]RHZ35382.1 hypothetical protein GvMRE_IIg229 [endosymbiont GvMRE of Glomus versiforme]